MGRLLRVLLLTCLVLLTGGPLAAAVTPAPDGEVELVLFWGDGCPHCAVEKEWLEQAVQDHPGLVVTDYEVWYDEANRDLLVRTAAERGFEATGVPVTLVGDRHWVGWSDAVQAQVEAEVEARLAGAAQPAAAPSSGQVSTVSVPLVGEVTVGADSLVLSTLVIGFVDGVNPCSLWVITVLLAIVVRTGSRRRVMLVGLTFLTVTAAMYALFMAGIYTAMGVLSHLGAVQVVVALVAGVFGLVSIKDYFAFKQGISFSIPDSAKPGIYHRMRSAAGQSALVPALAATVALAVGVSLLETPCTAGFPVLWTGLLEAHGVSTAQAAGLFALYMAPFLLDELVIFAVAVVTLRATKMQERHGRLLKLVAGTMMLALAITVLVSPEAMSSPLVALAVFGAAFAVAALVHAVTLTVSGGGTSAPTPRAPGTATRPKAGAR
jgi:cytochrome c biogenesis protein CcdA/glutaredoxin